MHLALTVLGLFLWIVGLLVISDAMKDINSIAYQIWNGALMVVAGFFAMRAPAKKKDNQ